MHRSATKFLLLIAATTCSVFLITHAQKQQLQPNNAGASCIPHERDALLAFKKGITDDPAGLLASWQEDHQDCCRWRGVRCSNRTGHVLKLQLRSTPTYDDYDDEKTALVGEISRSLLSLQHLKHLDLSMNKLQGLRDGFFQEGPIPEFLGSFKNLRYLNLSGIPFEGRVPPQIGNLSKLQYLDLSGMEHFDVMPISMPIRPTRTHSTDLSWLTRLPLLRYLNLGDVDLSMVVDWAHVVNMIPSLRVLNLSDCSLTSANQSLPRLNLTNLEELDLSDNYLAHPIESCWFWNLTSLKHLNLKAIGLHGQFPNALGDMVSLRVLVLSSNEMSIETTNLTNLCNLRILHLDESYSHGNIAELIERLPQCSENKLQELFLGWNNLALAGILPNLLERLTSLVILDISMNNITGHLPSFLGNLTSLRALDLSGNQLTGHLPSFLGNLTSLRALDLSANQLTGHLPSFLGNLTSLRALDLSANQLTGHVPSEISMLTNLTRLALGYNDMDGLITEEHFTGLKSLEYIYLSNTQLKIVVDSPPFRLKEAYFASCKMGPLFPAWLQWQVDLSHLDISNTSIIDRLPDWFCNALSKVIYLDMSNNQVGGGLPTNIAIMSLEELYLGSNQLTGQIPSLPRNLTDLNISKNSLTGYLPLNLSGAPKLGRLVLFSNYITGPIPVSICESSLYALDLANNLFEGELPQCLGTGDLLFLMLSNNSFSGKFPPFLQSCMNLCFLDLAWNRFSGRLPIWIGDFLFLQFLRLNHNMFYGHIPDSITGLKGLRHLNLAANRISGVIPPYLSNLTAMRSENIGVNESPASISSYRLILGELSVITKRQQLNYQGIAVLHITTIDFSYNYLSGEIPKEITCLEGLRNLNLSWNQLNGQVPDKIGNLHDLESLDLSNNNLSGEIPPGLSNLTFLSILDLSYNNLSGRIPSGRQLDTLYTENPLIYNGNSGLCGPPLPRNCPGNSTSKHGDQKRYEHHSKPMSFSFGLGIGFVVGLWVVFCTMLFNKTWRIAYFRLFDKVYDKAYVFVVVSWGRLARNAAAN